MPMPDGVPVDHVAARERTAELRARAHARSPAGRRAVLCLAVLALFAVDARQLGDLGDAAGRRPHAIGDRQELRARPIVFGLGTPSPNTWQMRATFGSARVNLRYAGVIELRSDLVAVALVTQVACGRLFFDIGDTADDGDAGDRFDASADTRFEPSGLVAHWKLDEGMGTNTVDSAGTAHGILLAGTSGPATWTTGHDGGALTFLDDGAAVDIGLVPALANLPELTVMAWVRPTRVTRTPFDDTIVQKHAAVPAPSGWVLVLARYTDGTVGFLAYHGGSALDCATVTGAVAVNTWSHVAASWDGTSLATGVRFYVDGIEIPQAVSANGTGGRLDDSSAGLTLSSGTNNGIPATLDDVRIYNRVLAPPEIADLAAR
jgi:hypothetical protein